MFELEKLKVLKTSTLLEVTNNTSILYQLLQEEGGYVILQTLFSDEAFFKKTWQHELFFRSFLIILDDNNISVLHRLSKIHLGHPILQQLLKDDTFRTRLVRHPAFIPALLKVIENGKNKNTSVLYWLLSTEGGLELLQQMLLDEHFRTRLFQDSALISTLLKIIEHGSDKDRSAFYWFSSDIAGCQLFQQMLADEYFITRLLLDRSFIPVLLKRIGTDEDRGSSVLFCLASYKAGQQILQQLLTDVHFKARLLQDPEFIPTLLNILEHGRGKNTSTLFWLARTDGGRLILQLLLEDGYFRASLLQTPAFILALLKIIKEGGNKDTSTLFWLARTEGGRLILKHILEDEHCRANLLQTPAFIPALLKIIKEGENKDTSTFSWLAGTIGGGPILQQLLEDEPFRVRLLETPAFISALLKIIEDGENKDTSTFFWLANTEGGRRILQQLLEDEHFRANLLRSPAFIPALLKIIEHGGCKDISALFWLAGTIGGRRILQQLLEDEHFRANLLRSPAFILALLKVIELGGGKDTTTLFWLVGTEGGCGILQQLLEDKRFRANLLQTPAFIPALLKVIEHGENKDTSTLFRLAGTPGGRRILQQLPEDEHFRENLLQTPAYISAFLKIIEHDESKDISTLFWLAGTTGGRRILQQLLEDEHFRARLLQTSAFIPALLKIIEEGENKDTSTFFWLVRTERGCRILQQLLKDEHFRANLLQSLAFIPALLKIVEEGENKDTSALYWLAGTTGGRSILQQLLEDEHFRVNLLQAPAFIPALLKIIEHGACKDISTLYCLAKTECGRPILQQLLEDEHFRANLLETPALIGALLKIIEEGVHKDYSTLYWLADTECGCRILLQLLEDGHFRANLLETPALIPTLLNIIEDGNNKHTSVLFWLTTTPLGQLILKEMMRYPSFRAALCQQKDLIKVLFFERGSGRSAFLNLLETLNGSDIIQTWMESAHFRENFREYFHLEVSSDDLSCIYKSTESLKLLLKEKQRDILLKSTGINLSEHPELYTLYLENIASRKEIDACIFCMTNDLKMPPIPLNLEYMRAVILSPEITRFKLDALLGLGFNLRSHGYIYDMFLTGDTVSSLSRYDLIRITQKLDKYLSSNNLLELDHPDYPKQSAAIQKIISDGLIARLEMVEGPQNKSVETLEVERLLRKIIRTDVAHIGMHYDKVVGYVLTLPDEPDVSINLLLKEANFNHIELTADEINQLGQKIQKVAGDFNDMSSHSDNFIVSRLPEAARIALNSYVRNKRYRNMNRLFRGIEQTSDQRFVWISPVSSPRNLLANFLCGCIVNWSAAELPRLLHGSSERILLEKILAAMPPTVEIKRLKENRPLYQAWIQEGLKKGVITVEEFQTLETLFFKLHLIYPQYGLVDRAENILVAEKEGEVSLLERRLANIVSAPSVMSMSVHNEGSPDFQHEKLTRTKLETDVSGRPIVNSRHGEILIPHGTKFFYAKGKEMLLAKEVYALNYDQHTRGYWSLMALENAYKLHFSKPYTEEGFMMVTVDGTPIYRPNHGLAHTFRVMTYIPLVIDYFAQHAKDVAFKLFCQNLSLREREWLKVAAVYSITGLKTDTLASEYFPGYDKIREDCMNHLHDFLTKYPMHFSTPKMQERMEHIVRYMGNPGYEIGILGKPAKNQHESEDERKQRNFLHRILTIAHKLDLPRCYIPDHFESEMQLCRELSDMSPAQQIDYDRMVGYAIDLLKAHGNSLHTDLSDSGEYIPSFQLYRQPFDLVSTNLRVLMQISETVPYPWPLNPCQYTI